MSSSPIQPDPKEAIEAQLCAYLEGDLSPDERAAIEVHLAGNPPHQQLLAELALARQWLRDVPKEPAPADVGEAFQQQLERSLLLGDEFQLKPRKSTGRVPQVALMAALILVTAGLGVGLMLMLTGPDRPNLKVAANTPMTTSPSDAAGATRRVAEVTPTTGPLVAIVPPTVTGVAVPGDAADSALLPTPAAPAIRSDVAKDHASGGGGGGAVSKFAATPPLSVADAMVPAGSVNLRVVTGDLATVDSILSRNGLKREGVPGAGIASRAGRGVGAGTQYVADQQFAAQSQQAQEQNQLRKAAVQSNSGGDDNSSVLNGSRRYYARGLTVDQTKQLKADLAAAAGPGQVTVATDAPTTAPDRSTITPGELITVVIPQLNGPGMGQTNTVRVAADGTIALPMIDPVPAAGTTKEGLARRVADRYRLANLIENPKVTVVTTVTPATQPAAALQAVTVDVETIPPMKK